MDFLPDSIKLSILTYASILKDDLKAHINLSGISKSFRAIYILHRCALLHNHLQTIMTPTELTLCRITAAMSYSQFHRWDEGEKTVQIAKPTEEVLRKILEIAKVPAEGKDMYKILVHWRFVRDIAQKVFGPIDTFEGGFEPYYGGP